MPKLPTLVIYASLYNVQGVSKNDPTCFCHNFVKSSPNLVIFGTQIAKTIELFKVHSWCRFDKFLTKTSWITFLAHPVFCCVYVVLSLHTINYVIWLYWFDLLVNWTNCQVTDWMAELRIILDALFCIFSSRKDYGYLWTKCGKAEISVNALCCRSN